MHCKHLYIWLLFTTLAHASYQPTEKKAGSCTPVSNVWKWLLKKSMRRWNGGDFVKNHNENVDIVTRSLGENLSTTPAPTVIPQSPLPSPRKRAIKSLFKRSETPFVVPLVRSPKSGDVPRLDVCFLRHKRYPFSASFIFDTSSALSMVVPTSKYPSEHRMIAPTDTTTYTGSRKDFALVPGTVTETIALDLANNEENVYTFPTSLALVNPQPGSVIESGVLAANRRSTFTQVVGGYVLSLSEGSLSFGNMKLTCGPDDPVISEPLVPYPTGEWAVEGSMSIEGYVSQPVTFLVQSTVQEIILPTQLFSSYYNLLRKWGLTVQLHDARIHIPNCLQQMEGIGITELPSFSFNVGATAKISVEIQSDAFIVNDSATGVCTLNLKPTSDAGMHQNESVIGTEFLKKVAIHLDNRAAKLSLCKTN